jgi:hypothetical protein
MKHWFGPVLACLLAAPAMAQPPMSGEEFDAYVTGKTLTYGSAGEPYGVERYLSNRRVVWAFIGDACLSGEWYEAEPGMICFVYEDEPDRHCWRFYDEARGLRAEFVDDPSTNYLYEVQDDGQPLICPDYGV